ncbi:MAG: hypothetical protein LM549_11795, partial [Candidatus Competibacter sp.]|nr:hypothetical protein [Candidatus Competibacter sp.]
ISETLDWARALVLLDADALTPALLEETLHLLVKYERDTQRVNEQLPWIAEPIQGQSAPQSTTASTPLPPQRPAEPDAMSLEQRRQEHTARYFTSYRGRTDGRTGGA